jgi:hypothetical protein
MGEADRQRTSIGTDIPSSQYRVRWAFAFAAHSHLLADVEASRLPLIRVSFRFRD